MARQASILFLALSRWPLEAVPGDLGVIEMASSADEG